MALLYDAMFYLGTTDIVCLPVFLKRYLSLSHFGSRVSNLACTDWTYSFLYMGSIPAELQVALTSYCQPPLDLLDVFGNLQRWRSIFHDFPGGIVMTICLKYPIAR